MNLKEKLYIESYLCEAILLTIESEYQLDKLGNIVFKDKNMLVEKINSLISACAEKINVSEKEIKDHLINIYRAKSINPNFIKEGTEIISILEIEENKEEPKEKSEKGDSR